MSFPTGLLISPEELAVFAIGSNDAVSFMEKLSKAFSSVAGVNAGIQVENGCLVHLVVLREPIPVENRKSYSEAKGFNSIIFEQIVAPTIYDDQQRADCKARLERGDYLIYKPAPPREWDPLPTRSSSSAPSLVNQGSQTQAIKVHIPMDLLEDFVYDEGADDDGAEQSSKRSRTLRPGRESSFRPHKTATGEIQYRMSVMAFADTGAAIFPRTDRSGTDTYWVDAVKDIMDHAIFKEFVRQEAERLQRWASESSSAHIRSSVTSLASLLFILYHLASFKVLEDSPHKSIVITAPKITFNPIAGQPQGYDIIPANIRHFTQELVDAGLVNKWAEVFMALRFARVNNLIYIFDEKTFLRNETLMKSSRTFKGFFVEAGPPCHNPDNLDSAGCFDIGYSYFNETRKLQDLLSHSEKNAAVRKEYEDPIDQSAAIVDRVVIHIRSPSFLRTSHDRRPEDNKAIRTLQRAIPKARYHNYEDTWDTVRFLTHSKFLVTSGSSFSYTAAYLCADCHVVFVKPKEYHDRSDNFYYMGEWIPHFRYLNLVYNKPSPTYPPTIIFRNYARCPGAG
ncbi:MAG: hypothetical protein J3Q66DRAFT_387201 [Benniella sp.]|nr:MAG: hypothetical protein J3Q66DRAFT_387201 [Benniella sp.]